MTVCTNVGKRLHTLPSHPTLSEHQSFSWGTLTNKHTQSNPTSNFQTDLLKTSSIRSCGVGLLNSGQNKSASASVPNILCYGSFEQNSLHQLISDAVTVHCSVFMSISFESIKCPEVRKIRRVKEVTQRSTLKAVTLGVIVNASRFFFFFYYI